jgi:hypothetical protein
MIMVDEAHKLCPQKEKSVSSGSVIDLQSLGRKRGLCGVLATQRLSKLNKDAAAECSNILVGRCSNVDAAKACDELGLASNTENRRELTQLATGEWKAVGPAFDFDELQEFRGALARTSHAKRGASLSPPKPSRKIKKVLPQLEAIQAKTVQEIADLASAKQEVTTLRRQLTTAKKEQAVRTVEKPVVDEKAIARAVKARDKKFQPVINVAKRIIADLTGRLKKIGNVVEYPDWEDLDAVYQNSMKIEEKAPASKPESKPKRPSKPGPVKPNPTNGDVTSSQQRVLDSIAWWEEVGKHEPDKAVVAVMAGYKVSGNFNNLLGQLRTEGYVTYPSGGCVSLTESGVEVANHPDELGTLEDLHDAWRAKLSTSQIKLLDVIITNYPNEMSKEELAEETGYQISGNFNNLLGQLRGFGVIVKRGPIKATQLLFPECLE